MSLFSEDEIQFYTIGYEGLSLGQFVEILKGHNVKTLVDIRINPYSRDPSFSKSSLTVSMPMNEIKYEHLKELGNPKRFWGKPDWHTLYRSHIMENLPETITKIQDMDGPVALMCMEKDPTNCHRTVVASEFANAGFIGKNIKRF
jgi:uncharacterized protein (DUF488 family)